MVKGVPTESSDYPSQHGTEDVLVYQSFPSTMLSAPYVLGVP